MRTGIVLEFRIHRYLENHFEYAETFFTHRTCLNVQDVFRHLPAGPVFIVSYFILTLLSCTIDVTHKF
jgi:hypothetical protein